MTISIQESKSGLRRRIRERLGAMTAQERIAASAQACARLTKQAHWQNAQSILFYASLRGEVDVWPLLEDALQAGKRVYLPRFVRELGKAAQSMCEKPRSPVAADVRRRTTGRVLATNPPPHFGGYVACRITDLSKNIRVGEFGIREPVADCAQISLNLLDLILVPGVAFDLHGWRLGRGKGFYDRLLAAVRGFTCGVAFDEQIVAQIPVESHDVHVNCILTPTRWLEL